MKTEREFDDFIESVDEFSEAVWRAEEFISGGLHSGEMPLRGISFIARLIRDLSTLQAKMLTQKYLDHQAAEIEAKVTAELERDQTNE